MNYLKEGYSKPGMENEMTATEANRAVSPRQKTQAVSPADGRLMPRVIPYLSLTWSSQNLLKM